MQLGFLEDEALEPTRPVRRSREMKAAIRVAITPNLYEGEHHMQLKSIPYLAYWANANITHSTDKDTWIYSRHGTTLTI